MTLAVGLGRALKQIGLGRFAPRLGLTTLWYGVRGQGQAVASSVTARLDVAILPAFVVSASVGLYSVATNVSLIVYHLSNIFAGVVVAAVAAHPDRARVKVIGSLWASLALAGVLALGLGLLARPVLGLVYGDSFRDAAEPLVLLLPGAVLFAGSSILAAGIYAAGRPFTATSPRWPGPWWPWPACSSSSPAAGSHRGRAGLDRFVRDRLRRDPDPVPAGVRDPVALVRPDPAHVRTLAR